MTSLSKDAAPPKPIESKARGSKYDNVNIRLYPGGSNEAKPYIPQPPKPISRRNEQKIAYESYNNPEPRRPQPMPSRGREGLRKVGYDAIHPGSRGGPVDYNRLEEQKDFHLLISHLELENSLFSTIPRS